MNDYKRCILLENFKKHQEIENLSSIEDDTQFSNSGCDICNSGAGDVYACNGYSSKHKEIFDGFDLCQDCLCVEYNGINDGSGEEKVKT